VIQTEKGVFMNKRITVLSYTVERSLSQELGDKG